MLFMQLFVFLFAGKFFRKRHTRTRYYNFQMLLMQLFAILIVSRPFFAQKKPDKRRYFMLKKRFVQLYRLLWVVKRFCRKTAQ